MSHRFFKATTEFYESARGCFNEALSFPNGTADTFLPPNPIINTEGEVVFAVSGSMAEWPEVAPILADLLSSGDAEEITWEEYEAALPQGIL